ncbi:uncharacterized protein LOC141659716 [Apium graveolens]|uniref:uncharacterized protein LOC141659716 n=1 Tax=Apium graveolens TaxID=4045 RepID=UPI003D7B0F2A
MAMIYHSISEEWLLTLAECTTAKDLWEAIKTASLGADRVKKAKAQTLKAEFESLTMKDSEQLDDFCLKLNGLVANIRALGESIGEEYVVKKILRAVPTKFLQIASALEQFGNLETMSIAEVIGSLKAHEERLSGQVESKEGQQLLMTGEEWSKHESTNGKFLLTREEWPQRSSRGGNQRSRDRIDRSKVKCFNCRIYGYFSGECRKPKRDRVRHGEANLSQVIDDEPALLMAMTDNDVDGMILLSEGKNSNEKEVAENMWYLDNGASNHMTSDVDRTTKKQK